MTDSTNFLQNSQAITSDLNFSLKPSGVRSRSYRSSILPNNKTAFNPTETAIFQIPSGRRNCYLDSANSYMRITIKNTGTTAGDDMFLDNNAGCVINRLDVFHGSNLLESIQTYNILSAYIFDMSTCESSRKGYSTIYGFNPDGDRKGYSLPTSTQKTFCIPILSGVCGVFCDKMLPIGLLSDDLRLEFTFESSTNGVVAVANTPQFQIVDFQLELTIVELSDEGENMVRSNYNYPQTPLYLHGSSWRHYVSSLPATSGQFSTLVPARFASLKSLVCLPRKTLADVVKSYFLSSRTNPNIQQYLWRIGSSIVPSKSVYLENSNTGAYGEAFAELLRAWHSLHNMNISSTLDVEYNVSDQATASTVCTTQTSTTVVDTYKNGFAIAQELESFSNRSDVLISGINTLNQNVFWEATIGTAPLTTYTLDFYANYDHILILDNGILSVKF